MVVALIRKARRFLLGAALFGLGLLGARAEETEIFHPRSTQNCPNPPCLPTPSKDPTKDPAKETVIEPQMQPVTSAALGDTSVSIRMDAGYIDNALPMTHYRLRYDNAKFDNLPDRAEFFYAKCGCFRTPDAKGPPLPEKSVDFQDLSAYVEVAKYSVFSAFVELPVRFLNPEQNANTAGLADMNAGFKVALARTDCSIVTFQLRGYFPTGDADRGLGTAHVSLEPSILFAYNYSDKGLLFGQVGDWIPIGGSDFAGNVIRYGIGTSYLAIEGGNWRVAPVMEVLGWTVLDGKAEDFAGNLKDAAGDTIVNGKIGVRVGFGPLDDMAGLLGNSDLYVGYGRAFTGEVWYKDILRVEYRMQF